MIKKLIVGLGITFTVSHALGNERSAPAENCIDTRVVSEFFQPNDGTLAIALSNRQRYRVTLNEACPAISEASNAQLLAEEGWMCGSGNEFVAHDGSLCPVSRVEQITAAEYANHARESFTSHEGTVTLSTVRVQGERRKGFSASSNFCFNPKHIRGWTERSEGILVEVNPRRSGGNRFYRVELTGTCPHLLGGSAVQFRSGIGIGLVCGNPGDSVLAGARASSGSPAGGGGTVNAFEPLAVAGGRPSDFLMTGSDHVQTMGAKFGCPIKAVYPHE